MDYGFFVFVLVFSAFAALIYSVFTSVLASRSGRPVYRKIMWAYLSTLLVAAVIITVTKLPIEWLAFGALFSCIICLIAQFAIAVKLRHIAMTDAHYRSGWEGRGAGSGVSDPMRNSAGPLYNGRYDPLRRW